MKAIRKCKYCGKEFVAKSGMQKFCCEECQTKAKEARKKRQQDFMNAVEPVIDLQQQEYLTFAKAAILMGCSRQYVYKLVNEGKLVASRISSRMAFIRKADIEKMLTGNPYHRVLPTFRYIHQNPVKAGLVGAAREYEYSSWPNDYLGMGRERVCYTLAATNRYGMEQLTEWIDEPLSGNLKCIDMDERKVVADEVVRELLLQKSGVLTVTEFRLLPKQVQKDLIRDVMIEIGSGPRQMSRVSGMSYNIIQYMWKNNEEQ